MKREWKDAFPPVDESFERSMDRAFEVIRKENRQVKKKVGIGFILVAALVLVSATAFQRNHNGKRFRLGKQLRLAGLCRIRGDLSRRLQPW